MDKFTLDKVSAEMKSPLSGAGNFQSHVDDDHSPWSYLYFYVLLDELDWFRVTKPVAFHRTGMAQFVFDNIVANTTQHIPINTCWANGKMDESSENFDSIAAHVQQLGVQMGSRMASLEEQMHDLKRVILGEMNSPRPHASS